MEIRQYNPLADAAAWDDMVGRSRNATFLHRRAYMDYHADRFTDASLMVSKGSRLFALLPATVSGDTVTSHGGLTYGGLLTTPRATLTDVIEAFRAIADHYRSRGVKEIVYKPSPAFYHSAPADEDLYALFYLFRAELAGRQASAVIDMDARLKFFDIRRSGIRRALRQGVEVGVAADLAPFYGVLTDTLRECHGVAPVHTLDELALLRDRFPDNIRLVTATRGGETLAGTLIFDTGRVAHTQYIAASPEGKRTGALDLVMDRCINEYCAGARYFDFGISTEQRGTVLNDALAYQKQGFGARTVNYDIYRIRL